MAGCGITSIYVWMRARLKHHSATQADCLLAIPVLGNTQV